MLILKFDYGGLEPSVAVDCDRESFDEALFRKYFSLECKRQEDLFKIREPEYVFRFDYTELIAAINDAIIDMGFEAEESPEVIHIDLC